MECLGLIAVLIGFGVVQILIQKGREGAHLAMNAFKVRCSAGSEEIEGEQVTFLEIQMKGRLYNSSAFESVRSGQDGPWKALITVKAVDITGEGEKPVLCAIDQLADPGGRFGYYTIQDVPTRGASLTNWMTVVRVPSFAIACPSKGLRQLRLEVSVGEAIGGGETMRALPVVSGRCLHSFRMEWRGYEEAEKNALVAKSIAVQLAMSVSAADSSVDSEEEAVVGEFIESCVGAVPESKAAEMKRELSAVFESARSQLMKDPNALDVSGLCRELVGVTEVQERLPVLSLCLRVAGIDAAADPREVALIRDLAGKLQVDRSKFQALFEKSLPAQMHVESDPWAILGIDPESAAAEQKKQLAVAFRKWNGLAAHSDPKIREQAEHMLDLITQVRRNRPQP